MSYLNIFLVNEIRWYYTLILERLEDDQKERRGIFMSKSKTSLPPFDDYYEEEHREKKEKTLEVLIFQVIDPFHGWVIE